MKPGIGANSTATRRTNKS